MLISGNDIVIDFETRSAADLAAIGAWNYSKHPTTDLLCVSWTVGFSEPRLWVPGDPVPREIVKNINDYSAFMWAHNSAFERYIWQHILCPKYRWPIPTTKSWRCSAALAARWGLPRKLETACQAAGVDQQKDTDGHKVMMKLSRPRSRKGVTPIVWWQDEKLYEKLYDYCKQDVEAERALIAALPEWDSREIGAWQWTEKLNDYGVHSDKALVNGAIQIFNSLATSAGDEIRGLTGGAVDSPRQVAKIITWLKSEFDFDLPNLQLPTIAAALKTDLDPTIRRILQLRREFSRSSVSKYYRLADTADAEDSRIRGHVFYYGAHTGRWSGRGIQTQNFKSKKWEDAELEAATNTVLRGGRRILFDGLW